MRCNCKITEIILGVIILVFVLWQVWIWDWIITIAAILLILHAIRCKNCGIDKAETVQKSKQSSKKKRR